MSRMTEALNTVLLDGLDLHGQIKVAHWNIKGPHFASLHPLFETFAVGLAEFNDEIAERSVTLGDRAPGTARQVAAGSRLPDYPSDVTRDLALVNVLAERMDQYIGGLHAARKVAEESGDADSEDLLTGVIRELEKNRWFLRASLGS
jgi:starvation-inducible DNA-binding protein